MKITDFRLVSLVLLFVLNGAALIATCGGGGGGGAGGALPGGGMMPGGQPQVYHVPWRIVGKDAPLGVPPGTGLVVLWFPASAAQTKDSAMTTSRTLTLAAARGVADFVVAPEVAKLRANYSVVANQETAVLTGLDGKEIGRVVPGAKGRFDYRAVEKLVNDELTVREKTCKTTLEAAEKRAKAGDKTAADDLQQVWAQRVMFPAFGKRAAKALDRLGIKVSWQELEPLGPDTLADPDVAGAHADVEPLLQAGLTAELEADYEAARRFYVEAAERDPADPTALRFLGEFYRHHTGEWNQAGQVFRRIVAQPADPIARAVALHGLGKMTIHAGRFKAGLQLFEQSLAAWPLAITNRNLAVYWFSEKQPEKAAGYMRQALALAPDDTYNQVFAAVYLAAAGHKEEALAVAKANEKLLDASYNLAAIWAQAGDRAKAMELLKRHFQEYERYEAVRAMEMKEAREDWMFANLYSVREFDELTKGAKNAWMIGLEWCDPSKLQPVEGPPGPRSMQ
ncbi:MAG TPA: tetratricopeptide repeat protein [Lacunisphaera sp.]|nr:tetratricopeptide repeat protein [Lacunisphaera sp.]